MFPKTKTKYDYSYQLPASAGGIMSLQDVAHISPFFTETNPVTYAIFLDANKNKLTEAEIERTQNIISHLYQREKEAMEKVSQFLKERKEYNKENQQSESSSLDSPV